MVMAGGVLLVIEGTKSDYMGVDMNTLGQLVLEALRVNRVEMILGHRLKPDDVDALVVWKEEGDGPMSNEQRIAFIQGTQAQFSILVEEIQSSFIECHMDGRRRGINWEQVIFLECIDNGDSICIFFRDKNKEHCFFVDSLKLPRGRLISGKVGNVQNAEIVREILEGLGKERTEADMP
jgi:hypothetical protein